MRIKFYFSDKFKLLLLSIATSLIVIGCGLNNTQTLNLNPMDITPVRVVKHAMGDSA